MKVLKRLVLNHLYVVVEEFLDPFQCAYGAERNVGDVVLYVLNNIYGDICTNLVLKKFIRVL